MAFSAFTVKRGVCSSTLSEIYLPTCPLLTFDLILLHLLSISTLALLLVILSTTLSPSYYMIHSPSMSQGDGPSSKLEDPESTDAFVMWEIALASPSSPRLEPVVSPSTAKSYGTYSPATPIHFETPSTSQFPPAQLSYSPTSSEPASTIPVKRDKFAAGRVWSYVPLMLCSIGAFAASTVTLVKTKYGKCAHSFGTSSERLPVSRHKRVCHLRGQCDCRFYRCKVSIEREFHVVSQLT